MKLHPVFVLAVLTSLSTAQAAPDETALEAKVTALMAQMTQEEKIGQLVQYAAVGAETGPARRADVEGEIAAGRCGSILSAGGARQIRALQKIAIEQTRLHIPLLFGFDVIHGYRTIFPINLGQAASFDLVAIERSDRIAAIEASAAGQHWTFAPMVDIARDPRWGRIAEGSGEDTYLGALIARARVHGFQGNDLSQPGTVLACAKHFAAYGAAQAGRDYNTTDVSELTLREVYLPPFKAALDAGVGTFMAAFNDLNGVPCSANPFLMTQVLRKEWGFRGFVVSDWMSIRELLAHGVAADDAEACREAMNAGVDMDMEGRIYGPQLAREIAAGRVPQARLDDAVRAVLLAKARLGLFEDPYRGCSEERENRESLQPGFLDAARNLARESCVLLKNDSAVLPLHPGLRIALVGQLADTKRDLLGEWRGRGRENEAISIHEAMEAAFPGHVTYVQGCKGLGGDRSGFAAAVEAANQSDVVVAVMGEGWYMSGEAASRTDLGVPGLQPALLHALKATGKPVVLVLLTGRPLTLGPILDDVDALLVAWFPGTMGGPAVTDLLSGSYSPSGKLPVTFPRSVGQIPIYYNHMSTGRPFDPADPHDKFKSIYLDSPITPQFPFGFGLSYTTFSYSNVRISSPVLTAGGALQVQATLTNTGNRAGTEVAQLYVRDLVGSVARPVRELKGFRRVDLKPGESRAVAFTLKPSDLAFVHADMSVAPEPGKFEVFLGGDSSAPKVGEFDYQTAPAAGAR